MRTKQFRNVVNAAALLGQRVVVFYLILVVAFFAFTNHRKMLGNARAATLSRLMPDYADLVKFNDRQAPIKTRTLNDFRYYFEKVGTFMPDRWDVYAMLGFCYHYLGREYNAVGAYERAVLRNPRFFWNYYNLGLLYYRQGDYTNAVNALNRAVAVRPEISIEAMYSSRLYLAAIASFPHFENAVIPRIKDGMGDALRILVLSYEKLHNPVQVLRVAGYAESSDFDHDGFFLLAGGRAAFQLNKFDQAMMMFNRCLTRNPNAADAYYYMGMIYKASGHEADAVQMLQRGFVVHRDKGPGLPSDENVRIRLF